MNKIYLFDSAYQFLNLYFQTQKKSDDKISIRSWAAELDIKQCSHLHDMLKGRRKIPGHYVPKLIANMKLTGDEAKFFELLVTWGNCKDQSLKDHYKEQLDTIRSAKLINYNAIDDYNAIKNPLNFLILELTTLKEFKADVQWIFDRIDLNITIDEIEESLDLLKRTGLITETKSKSLVKNNNHVYANIEHSDMGVREHHRAVCATASEQVMGSDPDFAEFQSMIFNIKEENFALAKTMIRSFIKELLVKTEAENFTGDKTYQLAIQFFPMTKDE